MSRLIGAEAALEHIANARLVSSSGALAAGLVDELVAVPELKARAKVLALELAGSKGRSRKPPGHPSGKFFTGFRQRDFSSGNGAPGAVRQAIDVVEEGLARDDAAALEIEARGFANTATTDECRGRIRAFFERKK